MHAQPKLDRYLPHDTPGRLGPVDLKHLATVVGEDEPLAVLSCSVESQVTWSLIKSPSKVTKSRKSVTRQ